MRRTRQTTHGRRSGGGARRGFTLIELMVALTVGAMTISSVYIISKSSSQFFNEQYRVSNTMTRLRVAMSQIKRDLQRAGYLATANSRAVNEAMCGTAAAPLDTAAWNLAGVMQHVNAWGDDLTNGMDPGVNYPNVLPADTLMLLANYDTPAQYAGIDVDATGANVDVAKSWYAFRRDFTNWDGPVATEDQFSFAAFQQAFRVGRPVRVLTPSRRKHFAIATATSEPSAQEGANVRVTIDPPIPSQCRLEADGGWIAPLKALQYTVLRATAADGSFVNDSSETLPQLHRREINLATGAQMPDGEDTVLLEYVVAFDVNFVANNTIGANPENIVWGQNNALVATNPETLRMARITLAARSPGVDPMFPAPNPINAEPFRRFVIDKNDTSRRPGAARVRVLTADVFMPNMTL